MKEILRGYNYYYLININIINMLKVAIAIIDSR